ncbi:MAG: hypothetical protein WAZ18_05230 [Alphaproteobacteria bacterium]
MGIHREHVWKLLDNGVEHCGYVHRQSVTALEALEDILLQSPPWVVGTLDNQQGKVVLGSAKSLGFERKELGDFNIQTLDIRLRSDVRSDIFRHAARHEIGHKLSRIWGMFTFFSQTPAWTEGVKKELSRMRMDKFRLDATTGLHPCAWDLLRHVNQKIYRRLGTSAIQEEAMAEMVAHYWAVWELCGGDEEKTQEKLTIAYPVLGPLFQNHVLGYVAKMKTFPVVPYFSNTTLQECSVREENVRA